MVNLPIFYNLNQKIKNKIYYGNEPITIRSDSGRIQPLTELNLELWQEQLRKPHIDVGGVYQNPSELNCYPIKIGRGGKVELLSRNPYALLLMMGCLALSSDGLLGMFDPVNQYRSKQ